MPPILISDAAALGPVVTVPAVTVPAVTLPVVTAPVVALPAAVHRGLGRAVCAAGAGSASVPQLRRFVRAWARWQGLSEGAGYTACLVVSELATNAVLHSGSRSVAVLVDLSPGGLRMVVRDRGRWLQRFEPRHSQADDAVRCGRGLGLVRALVDRCVVATGPDGTVVEVLVRLEQADLARCETGR
ncbi:ATP-binding protein [Kitasatospora sp. P5_F3]